MTANGLRYYDPVTATYLLTHREEAAARLAAEANLASEAARRRDEAAARQAAEARVAELEARLRARDDAER